MVVTRKGTSTPIPPNSRTNSAVDVAKSKPKKSAPNQPSPLNQAPTPAPPPIGAASPSRTTDMPNKSVPEPRHPVASPSPSKAPVAKKESKVKSKAKAKKGAVKSTLSEAPSAFQFVKGVLQSFVVTYLIAYSIVVCPHDTRHQSPVCNTFNGVRYQLDRHFLYPYVYPRVNQVLAHPQIAPVVRVTQPYIQKASDIATPIRAKLNSGYTRLSTPLVNAIDAKTAPYVKYVDLQYQKHLQPSVNQAQKYGRVLSYRAQPVVQRAAIYLRLGWVQAQPYLRIIWVELVKIPGFIQVHVLNPLGANVSSLYHDYVHPHLTKMVETVDSYGSSAKTTQQASGFEKTFMARAAETVKKPQVVVEDVDEYDDDEDEETMASDIPSPTPAASTVTAPDAGQTPLDVAQQAREEAEKLFKVVSDFNDIDDEELAAFLRDLGSSHPSEESTPEQPAETAAPTEEEIAEQKRQRAEEMVEKRKDIMGRHAEWERQLEQLAQDQIDRLPDLLAKARQTAVDDLKLLKFGSSVQKEADKAVKAVDAFVKKIMGERTGGAEKVALLDNLIEKIQKKIADLIEVTGSKIIPWWEQQRANEGDIIEQLIKEAKELASKAQGDLGLDYSWLDDVTVADWSRYHDLVNKLDAHKQTLIEIANGSDPRAPANPLNVAMRELQLELQTTNLRFKGMLSEAHRKALRTFQGKPVDEEDEKEAEDPTMSILPVPGAEDSDEFVDPNVKHGFVGKSQVEVEDAMKRAEAHDEL